jgi:hypothetical protein
MMASARTSAATAADGTHDLGPAELDAADEHVTVHGPATDQGAGGKSRTTG